VASNNDGMDDRMRQEWSRHYDTLLWHVTTIFTAGVGALFAYSFADSSKKTPEIAGVVLTLLGVFYVARFRVIRSNLHGGINNRELHDFLENPGRTKYLHMWNAYVLPFAVVSGFFIYKLAEKTDHFLAWSVCGFLLAFLAFYRLWKMGKPQSSRSKGVSSAGAIRDDKLTYEMAYDYGKSETYLEATRRELIEAANRGRGGQGAIVEAMFRLMDTNMAQERTTRRLNWTLLLFTIALFAVTLVQVYFQFHPHR
jgi:hypothetical protein